MDEEGRVIDEEAVLATRKKVLKFVGKNYAANGLSILVISCSTFLKNLEATLNKLSSSSLKLTVHTAKSIRQVLDIQCSLHFDFIVFAINLKDDTSMETLKNDLHLLDRHFLAMSRVCLLTSSDVSYSHMSSSNDELHLFALAIQAPLIKGQLKEEEGCRTVAKQIFNLATMMTGADTGVPVILTRSKQETKWLQNMFQSL